MSVTKRDIERNLFQELHTVLQACRDSNLPVTLIGGLATAAYLRRYRRFTEDIDLVVPAAKVEQLLLMLRSHGFIVTGTQEWWKASKEIGDHELIVDVVTETIGESVTQQNYTLSFHPPQPLIVVTPYFSELGEFACEVPAIGTEDLIVLKLLSGRDKDLIDLTALLVESFSQIDLKSLHEKITAARLQMAMSIAVTEWRNALESGDLCYLWEVTYDRPLTRRQVASLMVKIGQLVPE